MNLFDKAAKDDLGNAGNPGQPVPPTDGNPENIPVDQTKAFAERLKTERVKIEREARNELAQSLGYDSWEDLKRENEDKMLTASGLDAEKVKPIVDKLVETHPDVIEAKKLKDEKAAEDLKKEETDALFSLNQKYGTTFSALSDLDEATQSLYKKGVPLDKAYAAEHFDDLVKSHAPSRLSKDHLSPVGNSGSSTPPRVISEQEMALMRRFNPGVSDDDIRKYINKT